MQPGGVNLLYFKLKIFDQTEFIVSYIKGLRYLVAEIEIGRLEFLAKTQLITLSFDFTNFMINACSITL